MDKVVLNYKIINGKMVGERTINVDGETWDVTESEKSWNVVKKDGILTMRLNISKKDCEKFEDLEKCVKEFIKGN